MRNILIIEDNFQLAKSIKEYLGGQYHVELAISGEDGLYKLKHSNFNLLILDLMLPGKNGIQILGILRRSNFDAPILMLTEKRTPENIINGLEHGADDYLGKPFHAGELKARIDHLLTRPPHSTLKNVACASMEIDYSCNTLKYNNTLIILKQKELQVLSFLMRFPDEILSREQIIANVWSYDSDRSPGIIDVYISRLREKLDKPFQQNLIKTIHGVGYIFTTPMKK
ncbi:MAG: response regulator transcription factor [bacterium]